VLLRNREHKVRVMFPAEIFPRHELGLLRMVVAGQNLSEPEEQPAQEHPPEEDPS
jgi:hypothetical protein